MEPYIIDKNGKKRISKWVICDGCGIGFLKPIRFLKQSSKNYCSIECSSRASRKRIKINCMFCGKEIEKLQSQIGKSKHKIFFCSRKCKDSSLKRENWNENVIKSAPNHYGNSVGKWAYTYRKIAFENYDHICEKCGYNKHKELLEVHHIDRNRLNNDKENLMILCPNCHRSITLKYVKVDNNRNFVEKW